MLKKTGTLLLIIAMYAVPGLAQSSEHDKLKESVRSVLLNNPELIFEALKGHEDRLYDLLQVGMEKKNKARLKAARLKQLASPKKATLHPDRPIWGNPSGKYTIIVFSDFQSTTAGRADLTIQELLKSNPEINYRFRHNPLGIHKMSRIASLYYEALALQSHEKAKKFNHLAFSRRRKIKKNGRPQLDLLARECGADMERLYRDIDSDRVKSTVNTDITEAKKLGYTASPVFVVNGITVTGAAPLSEFEEVFEMINSSSTTP